MSSESDRTPCVGVGEGEGVGEDVGVVRVWCGSTRDYISAFQNNW